jgi:hypothetical protein
MWGDGEAFLVASLFVVGQAVLIGLVWFLIEIATPAILFSLYFVARGMLARVVNDRHHWR